RGRAGERAWASVRGHGAEGGRATRGSWHSCPIRERRFTPNDDLARRWTGARGRGNRERPTSVERACVVQVDSLSWDNSAVDDVSFGQIGNCDLYRPIVTAPIGKYVNHGGAAGRDVDIRGTDGELKFFSLTAGNQAIGVEWSAALGEIFDGNRDLVDVFRY